MNFSNKKTIIFFGLIVLCLVVLVHKYKLLEEIDSTFLTLLSGGIGFVISKIFDDLKESKQRVYDQKRKFYNDLIKPFRDILKGTELKNGSDKLNDKQIIEAMDSAFDNILYASDNVILKYGRFRNNSQNSNEDDPNKKYKTLKLFAELLISMRKDLGNKFTKLDEVHILWMFINMNESEENEFRNEFKKIKL